MMRTARSYAKHPFASAVILLSCAALLAAPGALAGNKIKLHGYITGRLDDRTLLILDDRIETTAATKIQSQDASGGDHSYEFANIAVGMLIEAEGQWLDRHKFFAEKITVDLREDEKHLHGSAYLQEDPEDAPQIEKGEGGEVQADGYWLDLSTTTKREWVPDKVAGTNNEKPAPGSNLAGYRVKYAGVRRQDGRVDTSQIELGPKAPADAYKLPHDLAIMPSTDPQTAIPILEFRQGKKVVARMKLLADRSVQEYASHLGDSLLPPAAQRTSWPIEFRFFVIEDPEINAASLPDGTTLINTGLLGAVQNESQLAFVLSHEIAHVLQAHEKREADETRGARVGLLIAGLAAGAFIGNAGVFLAEVGIASVVNGHERQLENQADRLGLQNVIERGYDPREAPNFSRVMINHYGDRSTSKLWSGHENSLYRGSFLTIQLGRVYPDKDWSGAKKNTQAFEKMKDDLGPVKVM